MLGRDRGTKAHVSEFTPNCPQSTDRMLSHRLTRASLQLIPLALHAGLSTQEQLQVFEPTPPNARKVIVATNIAEVCLKFVWR